MKPFYLTRQASADLDEIRRYLDPVSEQYAAPIRRGIRALLHEIATHPGRGMSHSEATRILGQEVRTRVLPPYRIFYRENKGISEVLAILHTARDVASVLTDRVQ